LLPLKKEVTLGKYVSNSKVLVKENIFTFSKYLTSEVLPKLRLSAVGIIFGF